MRKCFVLTAILPPLFAPLVSRCKQASDLALLSAMFGIAAAEVFSGDLHGIWHRLKFGADGGASQ